MKRTAALLLILSFILALVLPVSANAATQEDLRAAVEQQFDAYAAALYQNNAADAVTDRMVKHSLYGNGKTLHFSEKDPMTAALYQSNLFRTFLVDALVLGSQAMLENKLEHSLIGTNSLQWHDYALEYQIEQYRYDDTQSLDDDKKTAVLLDRTVYTGSKNKNDRTMMLVVGGCDVRIRMHLLAQDYEQATYRLEILVADEFEFDGDYASADEMGYNTTFDKLISALGPLLGMDEFFWDSTSGFEITVPLVYSCTHQSGDYRWEHNGTDLVAVSGEGLICVEAERIDYTNSNGDAYYYKLARPIPLLHDVPWVLEFRHEGVAGFMLGPDPHWNTGRAFFMRSWDHMIAGHYLAEQEGRDQYGFKLSPLGINGSKMHTFRIENRISDDGSNMLWLLLDGEELGPMNHYFFNPGGINIDQETTGDWLCGTDFIIGYFGGTAAPLQGHCEYIAIWQDGPGNAHDPFRPGYLEATCTEPERSLRTCAFCGYTEVTETAPALGHKEQMIPGKTATCTETGLSDGSLCAVCGETLLEQEILPRLSHEEKTVPGFSATCTLDGLTDGTECALCGESLKAQELIPSLGHTEENIPGTAPTCTETGLSDGKKCALCGDTLTKQTPIDALGHSYERGSCTRCGMEDPDAFLPGDANDDGEVTYLDAMLVLRISVGLVHSDNPACDMDGNSEITYLDAMQILRLAVGLA